MVVGIGTDIVNIERIENIFQKYGDKFLKKNFHKLEIEKFIMLTSMQRPGYLAKRFAAKEAVAKAFGVGIGKSLAFRDIAIVNNGTGVPRVVISPEKFPDIAKYNIQVSLSDDYPFAVVFVVVTR